MTVDKERLYKKLEHVGEHVVRENLENGVYGPNRRGLVEEWLEQFEDNEEVLAPAEEQEVQGSALAAKDVAVEANPSKKWYQRLLGIFGSRSSRG